MPGRVPRGHSPFVDTLIGIGGVADALDAGTAQWDCVIGSQTLRVMFKWEREDVGVLEQPGK